MTGHVKPTPTAPCGPTEVDAGDAYNWEARASGVRDRLAGMPPEQAIEQVLAARDRELEGLTLRLVEAERSKDDFLAMLGHELRNPLAPIVTALQLLKLKGAASEREHQVIERQVERLVRLVDDLLDVSRITRGQIVLRKRATELLPVVRRAIQSASPLLEQRAHTLKLDVPGDGLLVDADPVRLEQIVVNLVENAAKYTEPGGRIDVRAERCGEQVAVSVRDTGIGMTPETLARIFDLFAQGKRSIDRKAGGLGIGLPIVRSLVELHGGRVTVTSEGPGRGSEVLVTLPRLVRTGSHPSAPPRPAPAECADGCRVLIVDDNADAAQGLAEGLRWDGYRVRVAYDAPSALEAARQFSPEIALVDIGLPVMDGYELAVALRALPGLARLRLIAVSGYGEERDGHRSEAAGIERHMVKPVLLDALLAALRSECAALADSKDG
jgi:signal transduction histidine kinase/ActR/RegA family two-component response regulator